MTNEDEDDGIIEFLAMCSFRTFLTAYSIIIVLPEDLMSATSSNSVVRYLNSIVAWTAAVECLQVVGKSVPLPIRAHIITVPHSVASTTDGLATEFKARILKDTRLRHLDQALLSTALDDRLRKRSGESTIHAEAVMMALSRSFSSTDIAKESQMQLGIDDNGRNKLLDMFQVRPGCLKCLLRLYSNSLSRLSRLR